MDGRLDYKLSFIPIVKLRSVRDSAMLGRAKLNCPPPLGFVELERDLLKRIGARQRITTAIINARARDRDRSRVEEWSSAWYRHAAWGACRV